MKYVIVAAAAALALVGCNRNGSAELKGGGTVVLHGANGSTSVISKALPANMPAYVKLPPGAQVTASMDSGAKGGLVGFTTNLSPDQVAQFYKNQASAAQLTKTMDSAQTPGNGQGSHLMAFGQTGTKRSLLVTIVPQGGQSKVSLIYGAA